VRGMHLIVPPTCDLTVPLLGVYQLAGFADDRGFPLVVSDYNIGFCKAIVSYAIARANSIDIMGEITEERLDECAAAAYLAQYPDVTGYESLVSKFRACNTAHEYWALVDYLRACYDIYSFQFDGLRFRIDGFDCKHKWNVWADIESFIDEYSDSPMMKMLRDMISESKISLYDTIGLSVTFESQLFFSLLICKALRELIPDVRIVIGGGFINAFIDCAEALGPIANYCDCVFAGEGEALIDYLSDGRNDSSTISKSACLDSAQYIVPKDLCKKPLQVQPPRFSIDGVSAQFSPKRIVPLRFSYDCYWGKCKFCSDKENHDCLEKEYDIQRMVAYCIQEISSDRIDGIYFLDSAIKPRDVNSFASAMVNAKLSIPWGTNLRFEKEFDNDELIELMVKSGFVFAKFGLESGAQRVLDAMNKGTDVNVAASIISKFRKHGIFVHTYVMVAYPGETLEDRQKTEEFLLSEYSHPDNYNCSEFILYGGASIANDYKSMLKTSAPSSDGWHSSEYKSFTNEAIQTFIASMRRKFDAIYKPQSVLMSTGHTIAYAGVFVQQSPHPMENQYIFLSQKVLYATLNGIPCLLWWKRNHGCSYILGEWATTLNTVLKKGVPLEAFTELNLPHAFTEILWNDACIYGSNAGFRAEPMPEIPTSAPKIVNRDRFCSLPWYGQYDAS